MAEMGDTDETTDQVEGATRSGDPQPAGLNNADVPGAAMGSPGGAVLGSPGPGGGGGIPGDADLGGDGDLGGDEDPLRTHTAGGENSGG